MKNRIRHLLKDWEPILPELTPEADADRRPQALPRGINMLMPVELCINRELLISLLSASIQEIYRHKRDLPRGLAEQELAEVEAALQQQLAFRAWVRQHPSHYVSIAMYPVAESTTVDDLEDFGDL